MKNNDLSMIGTEVYRSWSEEQRRAEIGNLVAGFKNGLPALILCQMATAIAGSGAEACGHLSSFLTLKERQAIVKGGASKKLRAYLKEILLAR